jgi:tetratricopeptide (TPR) repeat protein
MAVIPFVAGAMLLVVLGQHPETLSLLGTPLYAPSLPKAERQKAEAQLAVAHAAYEKQPNDPAAIIAFEQATLTLGRVGDALEILTHGLEVNPGEPRLLLERGRSYIRIRKFEIAARDLRRASATQASAHCPLGLALYLSADYQGAREAYAKCSDAGVFGYLAARRAGQNPPSRPTPTGAAPSSAPPIRLPGSSAPRAVDSQKPIAASYLAAIEQLLDGKTDAATAQLKKIVEEYRKNDWMDPAYIAAETDYSRLYKPVRRKRKV